jgi:hypothetical protein
MQLKHALQATFSHSASAANNFFVQNTSDSVDHLTTVRGKALVTKARTLHVVPHYDELLSACCVLQGAFTLQDSVDCKLSGFRPASARPLLPRMHAPKRNMLTLRLYGLFLMLIC